MLCQEHWGELVGFVVELCVAVKNTTPARAVLMCAEVRAVLPTTAWQCQCRCQHTAVGNPYLITPIKTLLSRLWKPLLQRTALCFSSERLSYKNNRSCLNYQLFSFLFQMLGVGLFLQITFLFDFPALFFTSLYFSFVSFSVMRSFCLCSVQPINLTWIFNLKSKCIKIFNPLTKQCKKNTWTSFNLYAIIDS